MFLWLLGANTGRAIVAPAVQFFRLEVALAHQLACERLFAQNPSDANKSAVQMATVAHLTHRLSAVWGVAAFLLVPLVRVSSVE